MNKTIEQPNVIYGYDGDGELIMAYWQKEPIETRKGFSYSVPKRLWYNPVWRIRQWFAIRKPIKFGEFSEYLNSQKGKQ